MVMCQSRYEHEYKSKECGRGGLHLEYEVPEPCDIYLCDFELFFMFLFKNVTDRRVISDVTEW